MAEEVHGYSGKRHVKIVTGGKRMLLPALTSDHGLRKRRAENT